MDLGLDGRGFLVLGASKGLGRGVAEVLVAEGAHVVVAARGAADVEAAAAALGERARPLVCDVAEPDVAAVEAAVAALPSFDGVLMNSGGPPHGAALELADEDWERAFALLVRGPLTLLRALTPRLAEPSSVLWVTSSSVRQPIGNLDASNLFRPGIAALVKSLARDLAPRVRVNSIAPGRFDTDRVRELDSKTAGRLGIDAAEARERAAAGIPLGRYGDPVELGRFAAFLLSPAASYITGAAMQVDGGIVTAVP